MPILINKENNLAEDINDDNAMQALQSGKYGIPLNDPSGRPVIANSIPEAQNLMQNGHSQPNDEQLKSLADYGKYNTTGQKVAAFGEGVGQGLTFGLSTAAERALGVPGEDILKRQSYHPVANAAGQATGIGISSLYGVGEAEALNAAGEMGAQAVGRVFGEGTLAQIGSVAAKNAVQSAMLQSGNEVTKMIAGDPSQTAESAIAHVGLASAMGGAAGAMLGTVPAMWEKTRDSVYLGKIMSALKNKMSGAPDPTTPAGASVDDLLDSSGIQAPPAVKAALGDNEYLRNSFANIMAKRGNTAASRNLGEDLNAFKTDLKNGIIKAVGSDPASLPNVLNASDSQSGMAIQDSLKQELLAKSTPLSQTFDSIRSQIKGAVLPQEAKDELSDKLSDLAKPYANLGSESDEWKLLQGAINKIPDQKTIEDLRTFQTNYLDKAYKQGLFSIYAPMRKVLRDTEADYVQKAVGVVNPNLIPDLAKARVDYANLMDTIDSLNDRLHVGHYDGPGGFLHNLQDMKPEDVLKRMTPPNDAGYLQLIENAFPNTSKLVKNEYINSLLQVSAKSGDLNPNTLFNTIQNKWSPELSTYVLPQGAQTQLGAIRQLMDSIPKDINPSGTAAALSFIKDKMTAGVGTVIGHFIPGVGPVGGFIGGKIAGMLGTSAPDAVNLGILKYLGGDGTIDTAGLKAITQYFGSAQTAQTLMDSGIANLFNQNPKKMDHLNPDPKDIEKLDQHVEDYNADPSKFFQLGGRIGVYGADHQTSLAEIISRAHNYMTQIKPPTDPLGVLDNDKIPSKTDQANYERSLGIINSPLSVLETLRKGNVTTQDLAVMESVYPSLYNSMKQKIMNQVIEQRSKGNTIPYSTRLAISAFLGQNMDSTIGPAAMLPILPKPPMNPQQGPGGPGKPQRGKQTSNLGKIKTIPQNDQTINQKAEMDRISNE